MRLSKLAEKLQARIEGDGDVEIVGLAPIDEAEPGHLTFVANPKYGALLRSTRASAVLVGPDQDSAGRTVLRTTDPYAAFVHALALFDSRPRPQPGVHPTAAVAESATIGPRAYVGAYAVIGEGAVVGEDACIYPHVVIYPQVRVGERFTAHAGAVVRENVVIGDDVVLQPGVVIGGDGFGFVPVGDDVPVTIPQIGTVEIADHVEVGANTTVDRAAVGATRLERGVKLDNLIMIGHGSRIGAFSMLAGQCGMAGSTKIGSRVMAGGQVGFAGHLTVGDDVRLAAQSGVVRDVAAGATVAGLPAGDVALWRRMVIALSRLPELLRRVRRLEKRLQED